jgi:hypothetical protein
MRELIVALPLWVIAAVMTLFFWAVTRAARELVLRSREAEAREALAEQANSLLTGVAATFAFFVGFAISISWGAVTASQTAVEQQATAVQQMAWELNNIRDPAQSAALMADLRNYAATVVAEDIRLLVRGDAAVLPSAAALDRFENALQAFAYGPTAPERQTAPLISAASTLSSSAAAVAAVANRALPRPLLGLLMVVGVLSSILMGITTVTYARPSLIFIWCLIPAVSVTTVLALAYPFALRSGITLAPMQTIAQQLATP